MLGWIGDLLGRLFLESVGESAAGAWTTRERAARGGRAGWLVFVWSLVAVIAAVVVAVSGGVLALADGAGLRQGAGWALAGAGLVLAVAVLRLVEVYRSVR